MPVLVACTSGDGGSEVVGSLISLAVVAICLAAAVLMVRALGRDRTERLFLAGLLAATFVLGVLITAAFYASYFGDDSEGGKLVALLLIPPALGAAIAHRTKAAHSARAFLISTVGAVSLIALAIGLLVVAFLVGGGGDICLE
jgi:hypothetical protein